MRRYFIPLALLSVRLILLAGGGPLCQAARMFGVLLSLHPLSIALRGLELANDRGKSSVTPTLFLAERDIILGTCFRVFAEAGTTLANHVNMLANPHGMYVLRLGSDVTRHSWAPMIGKGGFLRVF